MKLSFALAVTVFSLFGQTLHAKSRVVCLRADGSAYLTLEPNVISSVSVPGSDVTHYNVQTKDGGTIRVPVSNCILEVFGDKEKSLIETLIR